MSLLGLLLILIILGFICWTVRSAPMLEPWFKNVIVGILVIFAIIIILNGLGFQTGFHPRLN